MFRLSTQRTTSWPPIPSTFSQDRSSLSDNDLQGSGGSSGHGEQQGLITAKLEQAENPTSFGHHQQHNEGLTELYGLRMKTVQRQLELAERDYQQKIKLRNQILEHYSFKAGGRFNAWDPGHPMSWWTYFPAAFRCPHQIERYGPIDDGGRWMCGMEIYADSPRRPKCIVYSFGLSDGIRWEEEVLERTICEIWVDSNGVNWQTLSTIMQRLGHTWIDILKVDIEGMEYDVFRGVMDEYDVLPFSQLQIELHVRSVPFQTFLEFWQRCESKGLRPFWTELNPHPIVYLNEVPWASGYSFININGGQQNLLIQNY
ncbi:hypothetical protein BGW42_001176 [Actinomortierella wolfii]|nr:hypothetical protein BGW42_001176 [Actinomortierella wolfii]